MKRISIFTIAIALILGFSTLSRAALIDNGGNLIYDTVQKITWYDYTYNGSDTSSPPIGATWDQAMYWAAHLNVGGVTGWTLPREGQMAYLDWNELGNVQGGPPVYFGAFVNLQAALAPGNPSRFYNYWSSTEYAPGSTAYYFFFDEGGQGIDYEWAPFFALAVHSGDVGAPVPIPGAILLFAPGLLGLAAVRRRLKKWLP
jgi:hypothetical protein